MRKIPSKWRGVRIAIVEEYEKIREDTSINHVRVIARKFRYTINSNGDCTFVREVLNEYDAINCIQ